MTEFSKDQRDQILGYFGEVRDCLRMQNWGIMLHVDVEEDPDIFARTWQSQNHDMINIQLGAGFFNQSLWEIRDTVVHELVHASHRDVGEIWADFRDSSKLPKAAVEIFQNRFTVSMERFVSWVTYQICRNQDLVPPYFRGRDYGQHERCYLEEDLGG